MHHQLDRIIRALRDSRFDDAIRRRALVFGLLMTVVVAGVYLASRWVRRHHGAGHRRGFLTVFILTPVIVFLLER